MTPIIRRATDADAPAILQVRVNSVRNLRGTLYTPQQIEAWVGRRGAESYVHAMEHGEVFFVADLQGQIVGFSSVHGSRLCAVYVHSDHARKKVGSALLGVAEQFAVENGCRELAMDASTNSEMFYLHHGYRVVERAMHRFQDGTEIPCVRMNKVL
jgi:GNAT superfamily N-acetyltransferase